MKKITIQISGMHCASCEMLLTDALEDLEGVTSAKVSQAEGTANITFDDNKANTEQFKKIIEKEGFKTE